MQELEHGVHHFFEKEMCLRSFYSYICYLLKKDYNTHILIHLRNAQPSMA